MLIRFVLNERGERRREGEMETYGCQEVTPLLPAYEPISYHFLNVESESKPPVFFTRAFAPVEGGIDENIGRYRLTSVKGFVILGDGSPGEDG